MTLSINTHGLLTTASAATTTGTLTASPGDLAVMVVRLNTHPTTNGIASGGGLNWTNPVSIAAGNFHAQIYIAPVYSIVTVQTITVTVTGITNISGSLMAITGGNGIGKFAATGTIGSSTITSTSITQNNGGLVLGLISGGTDTVITSPSTVLDNNGANTASVTTTGPFTAGTSVTIAATSAGSNLTTDISYEVTPKNVKLNNSGLRPHPFSPGLAR